VISVPPNWAAEHIAALARFEAVEFRPRGRSMEPLIMDGQLVRVEAYTSFAGNPGRWHPKVGDIVLVDVDGRTYLHLIKAIQPATPVGFGGDPAEYLIGNNRGGVNGWVWRGDIHGVVTRIGEL